MPFGPFHDALVDFLLGYLPLAQMLTAIARERLEHVRLPALDRPGTNSIAAMRRGHR